jgi:hypothetical protein
MRLDLHLMARLAVCALAAASMASCLSGEEATQDTLHVAGDYKSLATCLYGELRADGIGVGIAIDEAQRRARIWRDLSDDSIGPEDYRIHLTQTTADTVTIGVRHVGLLYAETEFMARLLPVIAGCGATKTPPG